MHRAVKSNSECHLSQSFLREHLRFGDENLSHKNQTQGLKSSDREETFPGNDNGNSVFDSNDNKEMGKKSSFLDYYISLEAAASVKENKSPSFQALCSCDSSVQKPSASLVSEKLAGSNCDKHSCNESSDSDCLPSGWERHEDDSGPYYWHISSGTIQRDPPITYSCNRISTRISKDLEIVKFVCIISISTDLQMVTDLLC
ncbi:hypothetical protein AVEN_138511-1 [Araneus ventricosus]|uniref:WW domain-containing protein n=1 Tax=Araneus ventricosus TaxID=182803 RepID=A0A4Y2KA70_ARAVE|nr:hypothetical protein AVEN_138511-1 [Araneus ventricosus]